MSLFEVEGWGLEKHKIKVSKNKKKDRRSKKGDDHDDNKEAENLGFNIQLTANKTKDDADADEDQVEDVSGSEKEVKEVKNKSDSKKDKKRKIESQDKESESSKAKKSKSEIPPEFTNSIDPSKLTPLQRKMLSKLSGSRFRWINEQLYTTDSASALEMIKKQPQLYEEYHKGFASQVESWPENPVDVFTRELIYRGVNKMVSSPGGLPGLTVNGERKVIVSDMGCGEANLAIEIDNFIDEYKKDGKNALKKFKKKFGHGKDVVLKNKKLQIDVHSFDLKRINDKITVADIRNVPLGNESVSVVIFCLSLMGTNFLDFIKEADRILVKGGELWITEIKSRLSDPKCVDFIKAIEGLGFKLRNFDDANKMFTKFEFYKPLKSVKIVKVEDIRNGKAEGEWLLKPCIYKRR
jgi:ribosomal RNA-processing protein 8